MYRILLDRVFGSIKVVPFIFGIYIFAFQMLFTPVQSYFGLEDYIRLALSRFGQLFVAITLSFISVYVYARRISKADTQDQKQIVKRLLFTGTFSVVTSAIFLSVAIIKGEIPFDIFDGKGIAYVLNFMQAVLIFIGSVCWVVVRFHTYNSGNQIGINQFMDEKLELGLIFILFLPIVIDPIKSRAEINERTPVKVESCLENSDQNLVRYFNTANGVLFKKDAEIIFITYDCLKGVTFRPIFGKE